MTDEKEKLNQLKMLIRLKELQKNKSGKKLSNEIKLLKKAQEKMLNAESRYQLILEMQRNMRNVGRTISPLYYMNQFEAADVAKAIMDEKTDYWNERKLEKLAALNEFAQRHCQLNVALNAAVQAADECQKLEEQNLINDSHDQQVRNQMQSNYFG